MKIDIDEAVSWADGFSNDDDAREYIIDRVSQLEGLPERLTLYRVLFLTDIAQLNRLALGHHWVEDIDVLDKQLVEYLKFECMGEEIEGDPYVIRASFDPKEVDLETTLRQNVINPHEGELFLRSSARPKGSIDYAACTLDMDKELTFIPLPSRPVKETEETLAF